MNASFLAESLRALDAVRADTQNANCHGPIPYRLAAHRMLALLPFLAAAVGAHGLIHEEVTARLLDFGGLAYATLLTETHKNELDAARDLGQRLANHMQAPAGLVVADWIVLAPGAGALHALTDAVLYLKACLASEAPDAEEVSFAAHRVLLVVLAWFYVIAVARGEQQAQPA